MSRVCQVTGKKPMKGHYVSHANNKTVSVLSGRTSTTGASGWKPEPLGACASPPPGRHR